MNAERIFTVLTHVTAFEGATEKELADLQHIAFETNNGLEEALKSGLYFINNVSATSIQVNNAVLVYAVVILMPIPEPDLERKFKDGYQVLPLNEVPDNLRKALEQYKSNAPAPTPATLVKNKGKGK